MLNTIYPIGSIYFSTNSTNPGTFIGGTWERLKHVFLLGAGDSTDTAGSTGGSRDAIVVSHSHTFSGITSNNGYHSHTIRYHSYNGSQGSANANISGNGYGGSLYQDWNNLGTVASGSHTHSYSGTTSTNGEAGTEKNMPPYLAVYMWKRTA